MQNQEQEPTALERSIRESQHYYNIANELSDSEIEELLSRETGELNRVFFRALKFVAQERSHLAGLESSQSRGDL